MVLVANKPENSRLNVVYVLYVLANYTDEDHPMSITEITEKVNREFAGVSLQADAVVSQDTVKRTLDTLTTKIFCEVSVEKYYEKKSKFGYYIHCVRKNNKKKDDKKEKDKKFISYFPLDNENQKPKKFYYYESDLTTAELLTLKDSVETYSYFSEEDVTEIVQKIVKLRPRSFEKKKYYDMAREDRDEDSLMLMHIEDLNRIIKNRNSAEITYCYYDMDKVLTPRKGYPKVIEPLHLLWSNGYYYLLAYNEKYKNVASFRVDRITKIKEVENQNSHRAESFNPVLYRHKHPVMYGGNTETIVLLCRDTGKNYIMNTIVDVFGKNVKARIAPDEMVSKYLHKDAELEREQGITWIKVKVETTTGGVELWATQYCNDCFVVSPETLRNRVRERLMQGIEYYQLEDE